MGRRGNSHMKRSGLLIVSLITLRMFRMQGHYFLKYLQGLHLEKMTGGFLHFVVTCCYLMARSLTLLKSLQLLLFCPCLIKWHLLGVKLSSTHAHIGPLSKSPNKQSPTTPGISPGLTGYITKNKLVIHQ